MLADEEVKKLLDGLQLHFTEAALNLYTATTLGGEVSVVSASGSLKVTAAHEVTIRFVPKKTEGAPAIPIEGAKQLLEQLKLAGEAIAAAKDDEHPLDAKSVDVECDFMIEIVGNVGFDIKIVKVMASVRRESVHKLILTFRTATRAETGG